jgi:hypothetical protein
VCSIRTLPADSSGDRYRLAGGLKVGEDGLVVDTRHLAVGDSDLMG